MFDWEIYFDLCSKLVGLVELFIVLKYFNCKVICGMGCVVLMFVVCVEKVLEDVGLLYVDILKSGDVGVVFGFFVGSVDVVCEFGLMLIEYNMS